MRSYSITKYLWLIVCLLAKRFDIFVSQYVHGIDWIPSAGIQQAPVGNLARSTMKKHSIIALSLQTALDACLNRPI
jgi:hypothetical protein